MSSYVITWHLLCAARRLGHMLRTSVRCRALLALTATATAATAASIAAVLGIEADDVVRDDALRHNLRLAVTHLNGGAQLPWSRISLEEIALTSRLNPNSEASKGDHFESNCTAQITYYELAPSLPTSHRSSARSSVRKPDSSRDRWPQGGIAVFRDCCHPGVGAGTESGATKRALLRLLQVGELADASSVIVYCTYQVTLLANASSEPRKRWIIVDTHVRAAAAAEMTCTGCAAAACGLTCVYLRHEI